MKATTTPTVICTIAVPLCMKCQRLHSEAKAPRVAATCDAFPEGIPRAIYWDGERHFDPYPGDNGLQFLPRPGFEDMEAKWRDPARQERERQQQEWIEQQWER